MLVPQNWAEEDSFYAGLQHEVGNCIRAILGLYWDIGKHHANYYIMRFEGWLSKNKVTTTVHWSLI